MATRPKDFEPEICPVRCEVAGIPSVCPYAEWPDMINIVYANEIVVDGPIMGERCPIRRRLDHGSYGPEDKP